jgi:hypothetical protein
MVGQREWEEENALAIVGMADGTEGSWWPRLSIFCCLQPSNACSAVLEVVDGTQFSLCSGFKGRYFPNCELLEAPKLRLSSYTWRSILFGMELLKEGIQWGIGNGQRTKLLSDNWIPGIHPFMLSPRIAIPVGATPRW